MRLLAVLSALVLAAAAASQAGAARRVTPQAIAWSDTVGSLYLGRTDGTPATTLFQTDGSTQLLALSLSPDGSQVLVLDEGDRNQLALVPASGGDPVPVAGTLGAGDGSFSPDGATIVFSIADGASDTLSAGIYTVPTGGGTPTQIVASPDGAADSLPAISPDGGSVAFVRDTLDSANNETIALELSPLGRDAPATLFSGPAAIDLASGGRLSFSPDGRTIAFAGASTQPGIFTISISGGASSRLTNDSDYWPSFTPDGGIVFGRDAFSANADDNADNPVAPAANDAIELWTMNADGSGAAVVAEGDYEDLATSPYRTAATSSGGSGSKGSGSSGSGSKGSGSKGSGSKGSSGGSGSSGSGTSAGSRTGGAVAGATAVRVKVHRPRYTVTWKGKAPAWQVTISVGAATVSIRVGGRVHSHTFTLPGAEGKPSVSVDRA